MSVGSAVSAISTYSNIMKATAAVKAKTTAQNPKIIQVRTDAKPGTIPGIVGSSMVTTYPTLDSVTLGSKLDIRG